MNTSDNQHDRLTRELLEKLDAEQPSEDFTEKVLLQVAQSSPKQHVNHSKLQWLTVGVLSFLLVSWLLLIGLADTSLHLPATFQKGMSVMEMISRFPAVSIGCMMLFAVSILLTVERLLTGK